MSHLHMGQVLCSKSQGSMQLLWNMWLQERPKRHFEIYLVACCIYYQPPPNQPATANTRVLHVSLRPAVFLKIGFTKRTFAAGSTPISPFPPPSSTYFSFSGFTLRTSSINISLSHTSCLVISGLCLTHLSIKDLPHLSLSRLCPSSTSLPALSPHPSSAQSV